MSLKNYTLALPRHHKQISETILSKQAARVRCAGCGVKVDRWKQEQMSMMRFFVCFSSRFHDQDQISAGPPEPKNHKISWMTITTTQQRQTFCNLDKYATYIIMPAAPVHREVRQQLSKRIVYKERKILSVYLLQKHYLRYRDIINSKENKTDFSYLLTSFKCKSRYFLSHTCTMNTKICIFAYLSYTRTLVLQRQQARDNTRKKNSKTSSKPTPGSFFFG